MSFNGTTERDVDDLEQEGAVWLPREDQLRGLLGGTFRTLTRDGGGYRVETVDTTGAGDAFNGALAAALAGAVGEPLDFEDAVRFAHAAAALQVTRPGAQPALPERGEVVGFLREHSAA